jgi:hypothetical protein
MDPRLQAGLELQLEKQAQQEHDSSLSGVLGQHFKKEAAAAAQAVAAVRDKNEAAEGSASEEKQASVSSGRVMSTMLRGINHN